MGTPMAVNFANLFMSKFEQDLLAEYERKYNQSPHTWIRFIDDIFLIWSGDEKSLKHFLEFCNAYAAEQKMASKIKFKYSYSQKSVNFLDTTVVLESNGTISTTLYSKPMAAHNYVHYKSYHYRNALRAVPKSQFIRIRRICTHLHDYWLHTNQFITFFANRGYNQQNLVQCAKEIANYKRQDLLKEKPKTVDTQQNSRTPLVINWHHKYKGLSDILHHHYNRIANNNPSFKDTFPLPPIIAYRRAKNISDKIIRANHWGTPKVKKTTRKTKSMIDNNMNTSSIITNPQNQRSSTIPTGSPADTNIIYAAKCKKHQLIYIGMTGGVLSTRFTGHRSDIKHRPNRCEQLPQHFNQNGCNFNTDLEVSVLEYIKGGVAARLYKEDKWIKRLDTISPNGLNERSSEFASVHRSLFD